MKRRLTTTATLAALLAAGTALADDDCNAPVADWQPRDALRQMLEQQGWDVQRIKIDDGCYEVKGLDRDGNEVEAEYAPDTLQIRKLETKYRTDGDRSNDRAHATDDEKAGGDTAPQPTSDKKSSNDKHKVQIE